MGLLHGYGSKIGCKRAGHRILNSIYSDGVVCDSRVQRKERMKP
jgi:hypothetical protein